MMKTILANCNECGGERNAFVRASYPTWGGDIWGQSGGGVAWAETMEILECCGCNDLSIRREFRSSELDEAQITYWPPPEQRKPDWHGRLVDDNLRQVMREVYVALNQGLAVLASIGVRTLLARAFCLLLGEDRNSFAEQLKVMVDKGLLLSSEKEIFQSIVDVGNAAAHRAHVPSQETLIKILQAAESFLYHKFILPGVAKEVKKETPESDTKRKKRRR